MQLKTYQKIDPDMIPRAKADAEVAIATHGIPTDPVLFAAEHGLHVAIVCSVAGVRCPSDVILKE